MFQAAPALPARPVPSASGTATATTTTTATASASAWVQRWSHLVAPGARVLDVACGAGRHVHWFAQRGCHVTGVDRDPAARAQAGRAEIVIADIEAGAWPLEGRRFDAVVVTNYLWRALLPTLLASLDGGGVLIYETFAAGNETVGKPSNPAFLLQPGELLGAVGGLRVLAFEDGFEPAQAHAAARFVQRIVAVRAACHTGAPPRYGLQPPAPETPQVKFADSKGLA